MVAVSERAKQFLFERRQAANINEPEAGLRVEPDPSGQWVLVADHPRSGDQIVEHEGVTILLVDPEAQGALVGAKVDCMETSEGVVELALTRAGSHNGGT
jgi:Fe-S cluster assembly iron-binding protein IscA